MPPQLTLQPQVHVTQRCFSRFDNYSQLQVRDSHEYDVDNKEEGSILVWYANVTNNSQLGKRDKGVRICELVHWHRDHCYPDVNRSTDDPHNPPGPPPSGLHAEDECEEDTAHVSGGADDARHHALYKAKRNP